MENKSRYFMRKEKGICYICGKPNDNGGGYCNDCLAKRNERSKKDKQALKELGICPQCWSNPILGQECVCPECRAKAAASRNKKREDEEYRKKENKYHADWGRKTYHERDADGICTRCGKRKADGGMKTCSICRAKDNGRRREKVLQSRKIIRKDRYLHGICYFCESPVKDGYKVCEKHYQMNVDNARSQKAKEAREKLINDGILY